MHVVPAYTYNTPDVGVNTERNNSQKGWFSPAAHKALECTKPDMGETCLETYRMYA